jgi:tetratricopeptide (TPR) repeat protein
VQSPPPDPQSEAGEAVLRDLTGQLTTSMHYRDTLITRLPLDESLYHANVEDARILRAHERAAAVLERMLGRFPGKAQTEFELGIEYFLIGSQLVRSGDIGAEHIWLDRAEKALTRAVEAEPTAEHLQGLGEILARKGHFTQAVARFREGIARDPTRASLHSDLADALMSEAGGENMDEPPIATPLSDEARRQRVAEAGRAALAELRQALQLDRNLPGIYTRMGAIYDVLGQPDDALLAFQEAVRHDPNDAEAHYTLGTIYLSRRDPAQALPELEAAVRLLPISPAIRVALATCYIALERWRDAERELDFVDEIQPGMPQVAELRSRLARLKKR